jgi:DNA modification methylase
LSQISPTLDELRVPTPSLTLYDRNPRRGNVAKIVESLRHNGQYRPIVVNRRTNQVLAGNHTLAAARELGWDEIAVTFVDVDDEQAARIALVDNRANDVAGYDDQMLADLLATLPDLDGTGFEQSDLDGLLFSLRLDGHEGFDSEPGTLPVEARTKAGDMYALGQHRLLCGDATSAKDAERLLGTERAELLFTSPPYGDVRDYSGDLNLDPAHLAKFLKVYAGLVDLQAVNLGLIRRNNAILPYWDDYIAAANKTGLLLVAWNVWDRGAPNTVAQNTALFPLEHEWILVFGSGHHKLNLTVANKTPGPNNHVANRLADGSVSHRDTKLIRDNRPLGTVFRGSPHMARNTAFDHPAMFPVTLPEAYIKAATQPGDIVVDCFAGAGTTLIAADNLERRARLVEIDGAYCDVIVDRWERHTGQKAELLKEESLC